MEWKRCYGATHDVNEVVFSCLYEFLYYVAAMVFWQWQLKINSCG